MELSDEMRDYPVADMIEEDANWLQKKADEVEVLEAELVDAHKCIIQLSEMSDVMKADNARLRGVIALKDEHVETWRDKSESYWFARLMQECGELGSSLVGDHDDTPEHELKQITAICLNWLDMRAALEANDDAHAT